MCIRDSCKDLVKGIRNVRTQMDVPPSRKAKLFITSDDEAVRKGLPLGWPTGKSSDTLLAGAWAMERIT